jgi:SAM-dependent methyltransferase
MEPAAQEDVRAWYNRRHAGRGEHAWRPAEAYAVFLDRLDVVPGGTLLDLGCGTGYLLKEADRRGLTTSGVDISDEVVRIAQWVSPKTAPPLRTRSPEMRSRRSPRPAPRTNPVRAFRASIELSQRVALPLERLTIGGADLWFTRKYMTDRLTKNRSPFKLPPAHAGLVSACQMLGVELALRAGIVRYSSSSVRDADIN